MRISIIVLALLWSTLSWAGEKSLVVGVEELAYLPSYGWVDGAYKGAAADIFSAFAADQGYKVTFRPLPVRRLFAETLNGSVDIKFPDNPEWALDLKKGYQLSYSSPVLDYVDGVVVKADHKGKGVDALHVLGTLGGFTVSEDWRKRIDAGRVTLKENSKLDQLLRQIALDRVDGAYVSVSAAFYEAENTLHERATFAFDPGLPFQKGSYMASSVSHPEVIQDFSRWMETHRDVVKAIRIKWKADVEIGN